MGSDGALSAFTSEITSIRQFRDGNALDGVSGNDDRHAALFTKQVAEQSFPDGSPMATDYAVVLWRFGNTDAKIVLHDFPSFPRDGSLCPSVYGQKAGVLMGCSEKTLEFLFSGLNRFIDRLESRSLSTGYFMA